MITPSFSPTATERVLPKLALDFTTASLDSRITFTRALNTATRTNSSGYVESVNADTPRFDYDATTLACKGLLIEESRINVLPYSEDFSNASWVLTNASVSQNAALGPDNTLSADKLIESATSGNHNIAAPSTAITSGTAYSFSFYAAPAGRSRLRIDGRSTQFGTVTTVVDLSTKTVVSNTGFTSVTLTAAKNDMVRVTVTATATGTVTNTPFFIYLVQSASIISYTGDGVSGVYLWGAQLEAGAFPTSYIPNLSTGTTTRNADVATMTGTNFSSWFNASEGTFTVTSILSGSTVNRELLNISDGTANNALSIRWASSSQAQYNVYTSGTIQVNNAPAGYSTLGAVYKRTCGYKLDNFAQGIDGTLTGTDTSGSIPTVNRAYIGAGTTGTVAFNGWVQNIYYWPQKPINAEITAFSKQG